MNKKLKDLLLQDLCARLPYGVKIDRTLYGATTLNERNIEYFKKGYADILIPYLRKMSSMTEEEKAELSKITNSLIGYDEDSETVKSLDFYGDARLDAGMEIWLKVLDWLNKKMFAYRTYDGKDMFELGLAIVAPAGMYDK